MNVENNNNEVENNEVAEKVTLVQMDTGETIDFGEKGKAFFAYDRESKVVTAKTVTGETITVSLDEMPDSIKETLAVWGLSRKLATSIMACDGSEVATKIHNEANKLRAGKFAARGASSSGAVELDDFQVAWALVNATGVVNSGTATFAVPEMCISMEGLRPHWVDVSNPNVIEEVLHEWALLPAKEKTAQRKSNDFVRMQQRYIESGAVEV